MIEIDKDYHRVPKIEEFIDGFEYEIESEGYSEDSIEDYWGIYDYIVGRTCWRDKSILKSELKQGNIRCKL